MPTDDGSRRQARMTFRLEGFGLLRPGHSKAQVSGVQFDAQGDVNVTMKPVPVMGSYGIGRKPNGSLRIWIDGAKLKAAGFVGGTTYTSHVFLGHGELMTAPARKAAIVCSIEPFDNGEVPARTTVRKVTGRPDGKPIIDMCGADVSAAFPGGGRIRVAFTPGKLVIESEER